MSAQPDPIPLSPARKAWLFLRCLTRPALARKLGTLVTEGYLGRTGWVRSIHDNKIVNQSGDPVPWVTYPFIEFLEPRLARAWRVFEFGAGASTRFFATRVAQVTAVEHDEVFASRLRTQLPGNVTLLVKPEGSLDYAEALSACPHQPELVIVDGVDRVECVQACLPLLSPTAVLVLDDAERLEYGAAIKLLKSGGFRVVEFWGLAPGVVKGKCTAVFYRPENVLGL